MRLRANGIGIEYELSAAAGSGDGGPSRSGVERPGSPVVTFSHALGTHLGLWDGQVAELSRRFRCLRYDIRGHGGTEASAGPYALSRLVEDVRALLGALQIERTHFVGISLGGMIGQLLALTYPKLISSLVLCDTSARTEPAGRALWDERIEVVEREGMEPHVEPTIGRWFTPPFLAEHPEVIGPVKEMIRGTSPLGYVGCGRAIKDLDLLDRLSDIRVPTLIVVGEADPGTPVAAAEAIHARIKGSELVVIPSASHLSNLEQPRAFNDAVSSFLEGVEAERAV